MRTTIFQMEEKPRPTVRPKEEIWILCERLGEKHGIRPLEVLKRLLRIGEEVAEIEEAGGRVVAGINEKEIEINVFDKR